MSNHEGEDWQQSGTDPRAWDYWKREWLAYQDPLLGVAGKSDSSALFRGGRAGRRRSMAGIGRFEWAKPASLAGIAVRNLARHLGEFNGSYLAGQSMPSPSWLSRDWLRGWTKRSQSMITLLPGVADHPLVSRVYSPQMIEELLEIWQQRQTWYAVLDGLPQTICHQDVFPRNAFVRHSDQAGQADQTFVNDWAFCGTAPVGAELVPLIDNSLAFFRA